MATASKKTKKVKRKHSIFFKILVGLILTVLGVGIILGFTALGFYNGAVKTTPDIKQVNIISTVNPSRILDSQGNEIIQLSSEGARRTEATSEEIPDILKWAFVDIEDERFYEHDGIDSKGILRAAYDYITSGSMEGASTIDQQLIKNNVFETMGRERSLFSTVKRKIQEWQLARELDASMSKDEIIVNYLNTINLGAGNYGVKEAAKYYFGKELRDLTVCECAVIAAITQNPWGNNPARFPEKNWKRASVSLDKMLEKGHITQEEYDAALNEDVYSHVIALANQTAGGSIYSWYVDAVIDQVLEDLKSNGYNSNQAYNLIFAGGVDIYCNQNLAVQEIVDREINDPDNYEGIETSYSIQYSLSLKNSDGSISYYTHLHLKNYFQSKWDAAGRDETYYLDYASTAEADKAIEEFERAVVGSGEVLEHQVFYTLQPQASFTVMDYRTGKVLAVCGGRGDKETSMSLSRATDSTRQPGSTFKITSTFAAALDLGYCTLATTFDDAPLTYGDIDGTGQYAGKQIANWWGSSYRGLSTIRKGIQDSMNIVACKCLAYIGAGNGLDYVRSFGYKNITDDDATMAMAIGGVSKGVTNLENNAAFSAIANDGVYLEPMFYSKIVSKDGEVILEKESIQDVHRVIEESTASLLTDAMRDVVLYGTGVQCYIENAPLAGKTGTSNDEKDLWFCGYVPNGISATIWMGYDDNMTLHANPNAQKRFYGTIMEQVVDELGAGGGEFEMKGDIVQEYVCGKSGYLPNSLCSQDEERSYIYLEYFSADNVPYYYCDVHEMATVCPESNLLVTEYCPDSVQRVLRRRPLSLDGTYPKGETADTPYEVPYRYCDVHTEATTTTTTTSETTTGENGETQGGGEEPGGDDPGGGEEPGGDDPGGDGPGGEEEPTAEADG